MSIFKLPKSPIYRGLARIFIVVAVLWTGLILFWIRDEHFDVVRPDTRTAERVDRWFSETAMFSSREPKKLNDLPAERSSLIQKAANTGVYYINGREQKLTEPEFKAYKAIAADAFSTKVKDTLVAVSKEIEPAKSLCEMEYCDRYISDTHVWDFRGVDGLNLEMLSLYVRSTIHQLNEIQSFDGWEKHFLFGTVKKYTFTGEFTGLVTEKDLSLLDDLRTAQNNRWMLKPLFWVAAWIVPLLGLVLVTFTFVELCRWIARGFRPTTN